MIQSLDKTLVDAVQRELTKRVTEIVAEEAVAAGKRVEERVRGEIAAISMKVFSVVRFEQFNSRELTIRVELPTPKT